MLREQQYRFGEDQDAQFGDRFVIPRSKNELKFCPLDENRAAFMEFADSCNTESSTIQFDNAVPCLYEEGAATTRR